MRQQAGPSVLDLVPASGQRRQPRPVGGGEEGKEGPAGGRGGRRPPSPGGAAAQGRAARLAPAGTRAAARNAA